MIVKTHRALVAYICQDNAGNRNYPLDSLSWPVLIQGFSDNRPSNNEKGGYVEFLKTLGIFSVTAVAEIVGCYLPYIWLKQGRSAWLLVPATLSLALFVWLLTLHPNAAGRVYAGYGGVYISVAIMWLWAVDAVRPTMTDLLGVIFCLVGMGIIMFGPHNA